MKSIKGFTVLEGLTIALIITILVLIAMPNFIGLKDRAKEEQIITNMSVLRTMLETYRVDWKVYPPTLQELAQEANAKGYNKQATNPYTNKTGPITMPAIWAIDYLGPVGQPGFVAYQYIDSTTYYLFGYDLHGNLIKRKGKIYFISNG